MSASFTHARELKVSAVRFTFSSRICCCFSSSAPFMFLGAKAHFPITLWFQFLYHGTNMVSLKPTTASDEAHPHVPGLASEFLDFPTRHDTWLQGKWKIGKVDKPLFALVRGAFRCPVHDRLHS